MITHYRTPLGAFIEVDSESRQNVGHDWIAISADEYQSAITAFAAVRPAARAAAAQAALVRDAELAAAYAALLSLGLDPKHASVLANYDPKDKP